ncbi:TonB-dependent receptor [Flavobacteriaceae bacterium F08102]|nr:TonB-dependent receptor [Flavobacteriaceae bacterium F08102]
MKYTFLLAICLFVNSMASQNCHYVCIGEVTDFHDGSPLVGATIYAKELDKYLATDLQGKFKFTDLCAGTLTLTISHVGCLTKTVEVHIDGDVYKRINLEHHAEFLDEITIHSVGDKHSASGQETRLKKEQLELYSGAQLGDALKEIAGISSLNTGNNIVKPVINGLHSSRVLIMNNGVRLQDQEWGVEHAPNIDLGSVANVMVIKGASALAYGGDAVGGVVVMNPATIRNKDSLYGQSILAGFSNGRGFSGNTSLTKSFDNGWFISGQASVKRFGDAEAPDYFLTNSGLSSNALSLRAGFKTLEQGLSIYYSFINNEIGILKASHIGNISDLVTAIESDEPLVQEDFDYQIEAPKQEVKHHLAKVNYFKRFENLGRLNLQYDFQNNRRKEFDIRVGDDRNKAALDLALKTHTVSADFKFDANHMRIFNTGLRFGYQQNVPDPDTGVRRLIPDYQKIDFGAFVTSLLNFDNGMQVDAGVRYDFNRMNAKKFYLKSRWEERNYQDDYAHFITDELESQYLTNPVFDYHNFSGMLGLKYFYKDHWEAGLNFSMANRAPNPSELFSDGLHHSAARIELGDLRLKQETSSRIGATLVYTDESASVKLEGYYNLINNYIFSMPNGIEQTLRGAFPVWVFSQAKAGIFGLDFTAAVPINSRLTLTNNSAYIRGMNLDMDEALIDIPSFQTRNSLTYKQSKWKDFSLSLKSEWVFEQSNYPNFNFEQFIPNDQTLVEVDISTPPAAYHLLHLHSQIRFDLKKNRGLTLGLKIDNIFNTSYRNYLNRQRYFADEMGRNISLQLKFNY